MHMHVSARASLRPLRPFQMAPTMACRFGVKCTRPECTFSHPWVECGKFGERKCREGADCANPKCGFSHPHYWVGLQMKAAAPPPEVPWVACGKFGDKRCREGGACENPKCGFAHPATWPPLQTKVQPQPAAELLPWVACGKYGDKRCRDGAACRNAMCGFAHPANWVHFHGTMLDEQMAGLQLDTGNIASQDGASHKASEPEAAPSTSEGAAADAVWPPSFIATAFTTRAAYNAWVREGADKAALP